MTSVLSCQNKKKSSPSIRQSWTKHSPHSLLKREKLMLTRLYYLFIVPSNSSLLPSLHWPSHWTLIFKIQRWRRRPWRLLLLLQINSIASGKCERHIPSHPIPSHPIPSHHVKIKPKRAILGIRKKTLLFWPNLVVLAFCVLPLP